MALRPKKGVGENTTLNPDEAITSGPVKPPPKVEEKKEDKTEPEKVTKKKTAKRAAKKTAKKAPKKAAKKTPKKRVRKAASRPAPSTNGSNGRRPGSGRRAVDFDQLPFGVVVGRNPVVQGAFKNEREALIWISTEVPVNKRAQARIGRFVPVVVETKIKLAPENE